MKRLFGIEFVDMCIWLVAVFFLIGMFASYMIVKHDEKEHEKRMKEIKKKEQV